MKRTLDLVAAPTPMQPGGYVPVAYADRTAPRTPSATLEAERSGTDGGVWSVRLSWECSDPVKAIGRDTDLFPDAAALVVPTTAEAPWITMGAPGMPIEGVLWRANETELRSFRAEGLGTVQRGAANELWTVKAEWQNERWTVAFELPNWPTLDTQQQLGFAIWRGSAKDRGGLKSVSPGWVELVP